MESHIFIPFSLFLGEIERVLVMGSVTEFHLVSNYILLKFLGAVGIKQKKAEMQSIIFTAFEGMMIDREELKIFLGIVAAILIDVCIGLWLFWKKVNINLL